jgi:hypothetical protein
MPKFSVTYSVNRLYEIIVEATDKEEAISSVDGSHGGDAPMLLGEEYLGINIVKDVTHEYPEDSKPKTKNSRKINRTD